jgi:5-methylcytosine-specific restriction protein A
MTPTKRAIPPQVGEKFHNRKDIWKLFGGQYQQGVMKFPGEDYVNVFFKEDGPYPDEIDAETGIIEYRGKGLKGEQKLTAGNKYLEEARLSKSPARFWFRPAGGMWEFKSWVTVFDRENIEEEDVQGNLAMRYLWFLVPVVSEHKELWPQEVLNAPISQISPNEINLVKNPRNLLTDYARIAKELENNPTTLNTNQKPRTPQPKRRKRAKDIVIARAQGICENDKCSGMPPDVKNDGTPIFQVDHIVQLSDGGPDQPDNMIALCPNCHAAKTLGKERSEMTVRLKKIALMRHRALVSK